MCEIQETKKLRKMEGSLARIICYGDKGKIMRITGIDKYVLPFFMD